MAATRAITQRSTDYEKTKHIVGRTFVKGGGGAARHEYDEDVSDGLREKYLSNTRTEDMRDFRERRDSLLHEIKAAFADVEYPGDDNLFDSIDFADEDMGKCFTALHWKDLTVDFVLEHETAPSFFSHEGFRYYLPGYLMLGLRHYHDMSEGLDALLYRLTIRTKEGDEEIEQLEREAAAEGLISPEADDYSLDLETARKRFFDTMGGLNQKQRRVVRLFLEFVCECYWDDEYGTSDNAEEALDRYWRTC